jgi:hypothetical protein
MVAAGEDPDQRFPGSTVHQHACSPCGEDYAGLLALVRGDGAL